MEISWNNHARNEKRITNNQAGRQYPKTILGRNCLLKHGNEGKIEGMIEATGTEDKNLLDYLKNNVGTGNQKSKH